MLGRWSKALAVYRDRRIAVVLCLGFSSGLPLALTFSTLSFWLKEEGLTNTTIGLFASAATPYSLKFLWAPLVDQVPIPFLSERLGRRRSWILVSQLALMASLVALGSTQPGVDAWTTALVAVVVSFLAATQDIVIDAYRVDVLEDRTQAAGAAAAVFGYRVGMLASGAGALVLATYADWFTVYAVMAALLGVGVLAVLLAPEPLRTPEATAGSSMKAWLERAVVRPFAEFMSRPRWVLVLLFVMLYKFGDALAGVMTNPFLLELGFTKAEIATVVKSYGLIATLVGAAAGGSLTGAVGMVRCLWICGLLQMVSNLAFAGQAMIGYSVPALTVTIGLENLAAGMGTAAFVGYLGSLCNLSYTATQYALLTSLTSVARTWLASSGGWLSDQMSWPAFFVLTTLAAVPGLLVLGWLSRPPRVPAVPAAERVA
jgi:PAT family beta-lactamase induction signal transducer AmpG